MSERKTMFGIVDQHFLAQSIGTLEPPMPVVVPASASVCEIIKILRKNEFGCLVVTNENNQLIGIVTERDLVMKLNPKSKVLDKAVVEEVMTPNPHSEQMTCSVAYALSLMSEGGFRHIPITDEQRHPVGIISVRDIIDHIVEAIDRDLDQLGESRIAS